MGVIFREETFRNNFDPILANSIDDAWHPSENRDYLEWWYFDSLNEDKSILRGNFFVTRSLAWSNKVTAGVRFTFMKPDGNTILIDDVFPSSSFSASKDGCNVRIGNNFLEGESDLRRYRLFVESHGHTLDLEFVSSVRGVRPNSDGKIYFNGNTGYMAWVVLQPRADVRGYVSRKGETWNLSGDGYHDHNWSTIPLINYLTDWRWGRIIDEQFTIIFAKIQTSKRFDNCCVKMFQLYDDTGIVYATSEKAKWDLQETLLNVDAFTRVTYPEDYLLTGKDEGMVLDSQFTVETVFERIDLLQRHPFLTKWYVKTWKKANPFALAFLSRGNGKLTYENKEHNLNGMVLHEIVNVKDH